jgi:hypothetical protein
MNVYSDDMLMIEALYMSGESRETGYSRSPSLHRHSKLLYMLRQTRGPVQKGPTATAGRLIIGLSSESHINLASTHDSVHGISVLTIVVNDGIFIVLLTGV